MKLKGLVILAVACLALGVLSYDASADVRNPGSCLLYPYYNTFAVAPNNFNLAVMSITNTCPDTIYVRLVWVDGEWEDPAGVVWQGECSPEDQWITLTGYDTFTWVDGAINPQNERGFMYAYVVDGPTSVVEVQSNCLIGQELIFLAWLPVGIGSFIDYSINAHSFQALAAPDGDGFVELDGVEFSLAPSHIYFPRFFGQEWPAPPPASFFNSAVILINLTGGQFFWHHASLLVYNDNEVPFSSTVIFPCWAFPILTQVSMATTEAYLLGTNHNPLEVLDNFPGQNKKTGWIDITGGWAGNAPPPWPPTIVLQPASFYAVLVEQIGVLTCADLPFQVEDPTYNLGKLWSTSFDGN
jgi:hypothetical protein